MGIINWTTITTPAQLIASPNQVSSWAWVAILMMIFAVILITLMHNGFEIAGLVAAFITTITAIFMTYMNVISWKIAMIPIGILIATIFYVYFSSRIDNI